MAGAQILHQTADPMLFLLRALLAHGTQFAPVGAARVHAAVYVCAD